MNALLVYVLTVRYAVHVEGRPVSAWPNHVIQYCVIVEGHDRKVRRFSVGFQFQPTLLSSHGLKQGHCVGRNYVERNCMSVTASAPIRSHMCLKNHQHSVPQQIEKIHGYL